MVKINKSYTIADIPRSLRLPDAANFEDGHVPSQATTTHSKREELLALAAYVDNERYNSRYKLDDIRTALDGIYHHKCAFCEQKIEQYHVEHYRPKQIYYWLAFSWDNLIVACPKCNEHKGTNFPITVAAIAGFDPHADVNTQSHLHDEIELPYFVNPEVTDPLGFINFNKGGCICSDDPRFYYTIRACKIDRIYLNDKRKKILDDFRERVKAEKQIHSDKKELLDSVSTLYRAFISEAKNINNEFLAFRNYAIEHWLSAEIKAILIQ